MTNFYGHFEISQAFLEIDERFKSMYEFKPSSAHDIQILSLFSQYMVILIARTLEGAVKNIIFTKYVLNNNNKVDVEKLSSELKFFQNPKKEKIFEIFKDKIGIELKDELFEENQFMALGQIMKDRNIIAHSTETLQRSQMMKTLQDIEIHYKNLKKFVSKLCEISMK